MDRLKREPRTILVLESRGKARTMVGVIAIILARSFSTKSYRIPQDRLEKITNSATHDLTTAYIRTIMNTIETKILTRTGTRSPSFHRINNKDINSLHGSSIDLIHCQESWLAPQLTTEGSTTLFEAS
jgi:hypothetical protein